MTKSNLIASDQDSLPTQQKMRGGEGQDLGGDGSKSQDRRLGGVGKGRTFMKYKGGVYCCGARSIGEEEIIGEVSGWLIK